VFCFVAGPLLLCDAVGDDSREAAMLFAPIRALSGEVWDSALGAGTGCLSPRTRWRESCAGALP